MSKMDFVKLPYTTPEEKKQYELNQQIEKYKLPQKTPMPHDGMSMATLFVGYLTDADESKTSFSVVSNYLARHSKEDTYPTQDYLPDWLSENINDKGSIAAENEFYFENDSEYMVYSNIHLEKEFVWVSSDDYLDLYKKGYVLVKNHHYARAIDFLNRSIQLNPVAIKARFELIEAILKETSIPDLDFRIHKRRFNTIGKAMGYTFDPNAFKETFKTARHHLLQMKDLFYHNSDIARFYRKLGFITAGLEDYKTAIACYSYSLNFEDHYSVEREIREIVEMSKKTRPLRRKLSLSKPPETYLVKAGIPVIYPIGVS